MPRTLKLNDMEAWDDLPEEKENECSFCGEPCNGEFCSRECAKANQYD